MNVLFIDFETTGLNKTGLDEAVEVGACLYDIKEQKPIRYYSNFIIPSVSWSLSSEIFNITGINEDLVKTYGQKEELVYFELVNLARFAHVYVAHNSKFDKQFLDKGMSRLYKKHSQNASFSKGIEQALSKKWVCSLDFDWPLEKLKNRKLKTIIEHYFPGRQQKHRALDDILNLIACAEKLGMEKCFEIEKPKETIKVKAEIKMFQQDLPQKYGFQWVAYKRGFYKEITLDEWLNGELLNLPFEVVQA